MRRSRITLVYIDSGGGHRAAATALMEVSRQQGRPWDLRMVSIQDLFDSIDFIRKLAGIRFQELYNIMLRRGWTAASALLTPLAHALIRLSHNSQVRVLEQYWRREQPEMVVSLIPHYNRSLKQSLELACPGTPFVTLLTDIADYPPHFWIERLDQWVICGSDRAVEQARQIGIPEGRIFRASGMILHPSFYAAQNVDRGAERVRRGLRPDVPAGLVLFGGEGSAEMIKIAQALDDPGLRLQLIMLCGKNEALAAALRRLPVRIPMFVEGFTPDVPMYMEMADLFIGKPGPGSISEALAKGLPVIVQRSGRTLAHERYNADWVEAIGAGIIVESFPRQLRGAIDRMLDPPNYERFRRSAAATRNRAVFEIPDMLDRILQEVEPPPGDVQATLSRDRDILRTPK